VAWEDVVQDVVQAEVGVWWGVVLEAEVLPRLYHPSLQPNLKYLLHLVLHFQLHLQRYLIRILRRKSKLKTLNLLCGPLLSLEALLPVRKKLVTCCPELHLRKKERLNLLLCTNDSATGVLYELRILSALSMIL
jgi:hypothetical protein